MESHGEQMAEPTLGTQGLWARQQESGVVEAVCIPLS